MKFPSPGRLNKTYIIPSFYGAAFALLIVLMLFMAFIYMNNLIYGAVFFVTSLSIQNMVRTAKNVESVEARVHQVGPLFALEKGEIEIKVSSTKLKQIYFIDFIHRFFEKNSAQIEKSSKERPESLRVEIIPPKRGELLLGRTEVQSEFPFGFFKSWKFIDLKEPLWIYPQRKGESLLNQWNQNPPSAAEEEFQYHEEFTENSSLSRIDWKVYARTQEIYVRKYSREIDQNTELSWDKLEHLPSFEDKLSQLSLWIWECHEHNLDYSLELPHKVFFRNKGSYHFQECMKELALWKAA
jgi:uncharacterized protein (DUF58 family)